MLVYCQADMLVQDILKNYDSRIRPVKNISTPLNVELRPLLHQVLELDEKNQVLKTSVWLTQVWVDQFLRWNASDYGGIDIIRLDATEVWLPDISVYNSLDEWRPANPFKADQRLVIHSDGMVSWTPPAILKTACDVRVDLFPFDEQICQFQFLSYMYDRSKVTLSLYGSDFSMEKYWYIQNNEWEIQDDMPCEFDKENFTCCDTPFDVILCNIKMARRPQLHVFTFIFPCFLHLVLGSLVYMLPAESGERVALAVTVLLSVTVLLLVIMDKLPSAANSIPLLAEFIGITIGALTLSLITSIIARNLHYNANKGIKLPGYLAKMACKIAPILLVKVKVTTKDHEELESNVCSLPKPKFEKEKEKEKMDINLTSPHKTGIPQQIERLDKEKESKGPTDRDNVKFSSTIIDVENVDWSVAAQVIDRMFLVLHHILIVVLLTNVYLKLY